MLFCSSRGPPPSAAMQSLFAGTAWREHMQRKAAEKEAEALVQAAAEQAKRVKRLRGLTGKAEQTEEDTAKFIAAINAAGAADATATESDLESHLEMLLVPQPDGKELTEPHAQPSGSQPVAQAPSTQSPPQTARAVSPSIKAEDDELYYNGTPLHLLQVVLACAPGVMTAMRGAGCHAARAGLGLLPTQDVCMKCGEEVSFLRATQKAKGKWLCRMCNSKTVRLTRVFGRWPPTEFLGLPAEVQRQFWADRASTLGDMRNTLTEMLSLQQTEHESTAVVGYGQPLSYWAQLGYDTERIKTETPTKDVKWSNQLGWCYTVRVRKESAGTSREQVRAQVMSASSKPAFSLAGKKDIKDTTGKKNKDKRAQSSSVDSNSDSSSPADDPKGKSAKAKRAQLKAERKEKDRRRKHVMAEKKLLRDHEIKHKKSYTATKAIAKKALSKCVAIEVSLERDCADELLSKVPIIIAKQAQTALKDIKKQVEIAKSKLNSDEPLPYASTYEEELPSDVKKWISDSTLLASQLSATVDGMCMHTCSHMH